MKKSIKKTPLAKEEVLENIKLTIAKHQEIIDKCLKKEKQIRYKNALADVKEVTPITKLENLPYKLAKKLADNSKKATLSSFYIKGCEAFKSALDRNVDPQKAYHEIEKVYLTGKNNLRDDYENYIYSQIHAPYKEKTIKNKNISDSLLKRVKKHSIKIQKEIDKLEPLVFSNGEVKSIKDVRILPKRFYDETVSPKDIPALKALEKENTNLVKNIYKYHKLIANKLGSDHFTSLILNKTEYSEARKISEALYDSYLSDYNYLFNRYFKKQQLLDIENQRNKKNLEIDLKIQEKQFAVTPLKEEDLTKAQNKVNSLETSKQNLETKIETLSNSIRKPKLLMLKAKLKETNDKLALAKIDLDLIQNGANPVDVHALENLRAEKVKYNKMLDRKAKDAGNKSGALVRVLSLLKPYKILLAFVGFLMICSTVLTVLVPVLVQDFFSSSNFIKFFNVDTSGIGHVNMQHFVFVFATLIGLYIVAAVFNFLIEFLVCKLGGIISYELRRKIKAKIDRLPLSYFDGQQIGDILSRVTNDIDMISTNINNILSQSIKSFFTFVGTIIAMLVTVWQLALVALATLPLSLLIVVFIAMRSQKEFIKVQKITGDLNGQIEEIYSGLRVIKLFNQEDKVNEEFQITNTILSKSNQKAQFLSGNIMPLLVAVQNIGYVFVCVVGGILQDLANVISFIMFLNLFQQPIQQVSQISNIIQQTTAAATRVFEILDAKEEIEDSTESIEAKEIEGTVNFEHVDFSYNPENPLIEDMNLVAKPGDSIAIVGPTGAGKTTLVNLIMRFYDVTGGELKIDGTNINDYKRSSIRKQIGMVLQDTWLFNGTIAENISYGNPKATRDDIIAASKKARAHHFIQTLEKGYDTMLNEDASNISQGQKQLITIARAILSNPSMLILDEATSSVDTRTEKALQDAMTEMMEGKTSFVIAHRLSTIKNSKLIIVMNKGHIIESGNHEELLEKKGFYYELYNSQFLGSSNNDSNSPQS